jgi:hypothetical protein
MKTLSSLTAHKFYHSILRIYISNLGARPVLVHFWDYIFKIWITVVYYNEHIYNCTGLLSSNVLRF